MLTEFRHLTEGSCSRYHLLFVGELKKYCGYWIGKSGSQITSIKNIPSDQGKLDLSIGK